MPTLSPCLNFNGQAEEAFLFYKSVFGGEFTALMRAKDMPESGRLADDERNKIIHVALPIGRDNVLMGGDCLESTGREYVPGNNFFIVVTPASEAEADKLFNGLCAGGVVEMPLQKTFWNAYFGMLKDKFGVQWMVNLPLKG